MKLFQLFFIFSLCCLNIVLKSQSNGIVSYKFVDASNIPTFYKLYFQSDKSIFIANKGKKRVITKVIESNFAMDTVNISDDELLRAIQNRKRIAGYFYDEEGDVVYKNFKENLLIFRNVNEFNPIIVREPKFPIQKWTLADSSKKIGKFTCQRALTVFRGRVYEVWYTLEIPVSNGPWKLQGLPGLILEAYSKDKDKLFSYSFEGIEIPLDDASIIKPPLTGDKIELLKYQFELNIRKNEKIRKQISDASEYAKTNGGSAIITRLPIPSQELNYDDLK